MISAFTLLFIGLALLGLGTWIRTRYQSSQAIIYHSLFLSSLGVIAIVSGLTYVQLPAERMVWIFRLGYFSGLVTYCMLLMFSFFYPIPNQRISSRLGLLWILPMCILGTLILTSPLFLQGLDQVSNGWTEIQGALYWLFPLFVLMALVWTLTNFFRKKSMVQGKDKSSLQIFTAVLIIASVLGLIFDVLLPAFGGTRLHIGVYAASVLFAVSSYIVLRK